MDEKYWYCIGTGDTGPAESSRSDCVMPAAAQGEVRTSTQLNVLCCWTATAC